MLREMYPDEVLDEDNLYQAVAAPDAYEMLLRNTLLNYSGNRSETAKALGISPTTLWRRMKKYGISD